MNNMFLPQTDMVRWMDMTDFPNEKWKDAVGFEDLLQVSNIGRVKRKAFNHTIFNGVNSFRKAHIVKPQLREGGYYHITFRYKGRVYLMLVHRLVAMAFIPNPQNLPQINHKDENPSNNYVDNLEWCTAEYNSNYGTCKERIADSNSKAILKYDLEGNFIREYKSMSEAERIEGINHASICICCNGRVSYQGSSIWIYKGDENTIQDRVQRVKKLITSPKKVAMYSKDGNYIKTFDSISQASKETDDSYIQIDRQLKTGKITKNIKHIWKQV